ncbi:zinc ribbon domain-containing protein [Paratractidigestivibacter faecalis]|uniref:hypothetical protein n=1 Tax=Paratractidigestivibacter faecalis TaxID=2292441 RepID=UPI0011CBAAAD|nr:hypothetical protein [Paratractidigestivibacter faecalis]
MGKAMFSSDVVGTDSFLDLPEEAQLLYHRLGFEGAYGKIVGIRRIARGFGASTDALDALYKSGYLFDYGDACWVRHYWVNNTFKKPNNNPAKNIPEIASGEIGFAGEEFRSAFVCPSVDKPSNGLTAAYRAAYQAGYTVTGTVTGPASATGAETGSTTEALADSISNSDTAASTGTGEEARGEGDGSHPCCCQKCGSQKATYREEGGKIFIRCPDCGESEFSYSH